MLDAANPVEVDPEMDAIYPGRYAGILRVLLRDGRQFSKRVDYSRGMPEWPDGCGGAAVQVLLPGERRGGPGGDRACLRDAADGVYPARYGRARPHGGRLADAGVAVMKIGFIGLGTRGGGMAANLQHAQFSLTVHARRREAAEPFLTAGRPGPQPRGSWRQGATSCSSACRGLRRWSRWCPARTACWRGCSRVLRCST